MIIANELDEVKKPGRGGVTSSHRSRETLYFKYQYCSAEENLNGSFVIHNKRYTIPISEMWTQRRSSPRAAWASSTAPAHDRPGTLAPSLATPRCRLRRRRACSRASRAGVGCQSKRDSRLARPPSHAAPRLCYSDRIPEHSTNAQQNGQFTISTGSQTR
jgi:hypothetical protein